MNYLIFLAKSEEKNNIELLVKEYRKEQRKIGFFKRFFYEISFFDLHSINT